MRPDPRTGEGLSRAAAFLIVASLTLVGAALRIATIDTRGFWLDETTSVRQASWGIAQMLEKMAGNVHPPLFHTLLHYWIVYFGRSEVAVRGFPIVWGIVAIPLMYWVARDIYDRRVGAIAAAMVAISPFLIWYAQEARMYTMVLVFALLSTGALWKGLRRRGFGWWVLYALATSAGLMTQYFFAFLVLGQGVYVLFAHARGRMHAEDPAGEPRPRSTPPLGAVRRLPEVAAWVGALLVAMVPLAWWLPKVIAHRELLRGATGAFNYGGEPPVIGAHFNQLILVPVESLFGFHSEAITRDLVAMWPLLITLVFVSAGFARHVSPRTRYLIAGGVGGALAITLLGSWQPIVLEARYYTAVGVCVVILAARAVAEMRTSARWATAAVLVVVAAAAWTDQSFDPSSVVKWENREAMALVAARYQQGDTILLLPNFVTSIPEYYLPPDAYAAVRAVPLYGAKGRPRNSPAQLAQDLVRQVGISRRVWVVATWQETPRIALDRTLVTRWLTAESYVLKQDRKFRRIRVTLYEVGTQRGFFLNPVVRP